MSTWAHCDTSTRRHCETVRDFPMVILCLFSCRHRVRERGNSTLAISVSDSTNFRGTKECIYVCNFASIHRRTHQDLLLLWKWMILPHQLVEWDVRQIGLKFDASPRRFSTCDSVIWGLMTLKTLLLHSIIQQDGKSLRRKKKRFLTSFNTHFYCSSEANLKTFETCRCLLLQLSKELGYNLNS